MEAVEIGSENHHLFGLSTKTERLRGHRYYYEEL